jgi:uncharacterized phage-like protein YoqJ
MDDKQIKSELIVAFSGHRPNKIGGYKLPNPTYNYICQQLKTTLELLKPSKAISGMALGIDQWAAYICSQLGIPFIAAVPFIGQEKAWPKESQDIYHKLLKKASEVVIVSEGDYSAQKMQIRNQWMVDRCNKLIAVWDGTPGGTHNCMQYAKSIGCDIILIDLKAYNETQKTQS